MLSVAGLTKTYGDVAAVDDLSFTVDSGSVVGLLGPNGSGKTTTMKMMLGLARPTSGSVRLLGIENHSADFPHAVRRVGALIEDPAIYERLSARQNLELQARSLRVSATAERIDELLDLVDLADRARDRAGTYSLGMKQRLGIAIAMVANPELLILDEPANGLDPAGIADIRDLLRRLPDRGTTVLVSSHQLSEVQQACERLVILSEGRLLAQGRTEDILEQHRSHKVCVRLDPNEIPVAVACLDRLQLGVDRGRADELVVELPQDWTGRDLNRSLVSAGVYADEIAGEAVSLESAFLTMTGASQ